MESTLLSAPTTKSLPTLSKSINSSSRSFSCHFRRHSSAPPPNHFVSPSLLARAGLGSSRPRRFGDLSRFGSISLTNSSRAPYLRPVQKELRSDSGFAASSATGGGGNDGVSDDASALPSDVIVLHVSGMKCEGCTSSVKRILESQSQVSSATVNLTMGTATIWPVSEAKAVAEWQKQLGEGLAKHLTNSGFESKFQGQGAPTEGEIRS